MSAGPARTDPTRTPRVALGLAATALGGLDILGVSPIGLFVSMMTWLAVELPAWVARWLPRAHLGWFVGAAEVLIGVGLLAGRRIRP
jgi:hypothetical protein